MVLLLSPHQQQEWHVDEAELDYTFLIFREDFMRTFIADKFFVYRLLYYYQTDTPPYLFAAPEELAEYMRLLGKIKQELLHPVADTVSRITLNNSVMAQFGVSATHLLKQRLLEELKNELLFSDRNVSQLADEFHFSDPSHLMRFFKQQTGKTFTQYITDYQNGIYE